MTFRKIVDALIGKKPDEQKYHWRECDGIFDRTLTMSSPLKNDKKKQTPSKAFTQPDNEEEKSALKSWVDQEQLDAQAASANQNIQALPLTLQQQIVKKSGFVVENFSVISRLESKGVLTDIKEYTKEQRKKKPDKEKLEKLLKGMNLSDLSEFNIALVNLENLQAYFTTSPSYVIENPPLKALYEDFKNLHKDEIAKKLQEYDAEKIYIRQILFPTALVQAVPATNDIESPSLMRRRQ